MNRYSKLSLTTAAAAMFAGAAANASPFVDINFNSDTVGSAPTTVGYQPTLTNLSAIGGYGPLTPDPGDSPPTADEGTIVVDNAGGMNKGVHMTTNPLDNALGALYLDTDFSYTSQYVHMSFDLNILNAPTASTSQLKLLNGGPATAGILFGMNTFGTDQGTRFAAAPTSVDGGVFAIRSPDNTSLQSFFNYIEGQTYHIDLVSDYDTGMVETYVDGVDEGSYAFATGAQAANTTQEFFFHLNGDLGSDSQVALDNITATPEPTSLGLIGLVSLGLLRRRRRNI
jgi:hypothetical protein